jgi:hypothetical protein
MPAGMAPIAMWTIATDDAALRMFDANEDVGREFRIDHNEMFPRAICLTID